MTSPATLTARPATRRPDGRSDTRQRRSAPSSGLITYELPLNERIRTLLRLEHLFQQGRHHLNGTTVWDSRAALGNLLDILTIFGRSDLKSEVMKELERHSSNLSRMRQTPGVDQARLQEVLAEIAELMGRLYDHKGQTGSKLRQNEFIKSIMQRSSIPGGTCDFDLPQFHWWLQKPADERKHTLTGWLSCFSLIEEAVALILRLTRGAGTTSREIARAGFFQQSLGSNLPCQLIRTVVPADLPYYVEVSGGKHRFAVRFLCPTLDGRQCQAEEDLVFELCRCVI